MHIFILKGLSHRIISICLLSVSPTLWGQRSNLSCSLQYPLLEKSNLTQSKCSMNIAGQMQKCMKAIAWCFTTHHHEAQPCIWLKRKESSYSALYSVPYSAPTLCGLSPLPQDTPLLFILWMFKYQEICRRPMRAGSSEGLETPPVTGPRVGLTRGCQPLIQRFIKLPDINLLNHHMLMNTCSSRTFCGGPHYWKCACSVGSPKKGFMDTTPSVHTYTSQI